MSGFSTRMPELQYTWEGVKIADHGNSGFTTQTALEQYNAHRQALQKQARMIRQQMGHVTNLGWTKWLDSDSDLKDRLAGLRKRFADTPEAYWNAAIQAIQKPYQQAQIAEAKAKARAAKKRAEEQQKHKIAGMILAGMSPEEAAAFQADESAWDAFFANIRTDDGDQSYFSGLSTVKDWRISQIPIFNDFQQPGQHAEIAPTLSEMELMAMLQGYGISKSLSSSIYTTITHQPELFNALIFQKGSVEGALLALIPQCHWLPNTADLAGASRRIAQQLGISSVGEDAGRLLDYFTPGAGETGVGLPGLSTQTTLSPELEWSAIAFAELIELTNPPSPVDNVGGGGLQSVPPPTDQEVWQHLEDALNRLRVAASPDDYAALNAITQPLLEELKKENPNFDNIDLDVLAGAMSTAFGYTIAWDVYFDDDNQRTRLLLNLLTSNLHSIASIEEEFQFLKRYEEFSTQSLIYDFDIKGRRSLSGLGLFQKRFETLDDEEVYTVWLGANDKTGGAFLGKVPLPESKPSKEELHAIYLGSQMTVEDISHEMGHQLDRRLYPDPTEDRRDLNQPFNDAGLANLEGFGGYVLLTERASTQNKPAEWFADLQMMAELHGQGFANVGWNYDRSPKDVPIARIARAAFMFATLDSEITQICFTRNDGNLVCYADKE